MSEHSKKKVAPVVVTIIAIIYYIVYFGIMICMLPLGFKILLGIVPLILTITTIYVCKERLDEIDGGEEDDLSKY